MLYLLLNFRDLPSGIPNMPETVYSVCRGSLESLIRELQSYTNSCEDKCFFLGSGLLLVLPLHVVFGLFLDPNFDDLKDSWHPVVDGIWKRVPRSGKLPLPGQGKGGSHAELGIISND